MGCAASRFLTVALLAVLPSTLLADLSGIVNDVRAQSCNNSAPGVHLLRAEARLDDAARRLADGANLENATAAAHYPAKVSASIRLRNLLGDAGLAQILASDFCDIVGDAELTEMGAYSVGPETWLVFAAPFTPLDSVAPAERDRRVLQLVNEARRHARRCGRKELGPAAPLQGDAALVTAAQAHARDMAANNFLDHEGSSGSKPGDRATLAGYVWTSYGENIAAGQTTAEEVVATWLASPGHCETLMNPRYIDTGIAHAVNRDADKGTYWVQIFGKPR